MDGIDWGRWRGAHGVMTWTLGAICNYAYTALPWCIQRHAGFLLPRAGDFIFWRDARTAMRMAGVVSTPQPVNR